MDGCLNIVWEPLKVILASLMGWKELTYREVVAYFASKENYPPISFEKGAVIKEDTPLGYLVRFVFLDMNDQPLMDTQNRVYGIVIKAYKFDPELASRFGDKDVLIVT